MRWGWVGGVVTVDHLLPVLGQLNVTQQQLDKSATGEAQKLVDFVSSSLCMEEEVTLEGGVTLKLSGKSTLDKVSPAMRISANCRILRRLMNDTPDFNMEEYLQYTEMIRELATRFTSQSLQ